jgi:hypothetical protein
MSLRRGASLAAFFPKIKAKTKQKRDKNHWQIALQNIKQLNYQSLEKCICRMVIAVIG